MYLLSLNTQMWVSEQDLDVLESQVNSWDTNVFAIDVSFIN